MRQTRVVLMVGGGVLLLCVLALVVTLADYTSSPTGVANAHVPPLTGTPVPTDSAPTAVPTIPVTTVDQPTPTPAAPAPVAVAGRPGRTQTGQLTLAQLLQQLQQRRHHTPPTLPPQPR